MPRRRTIALADAVEQPDRAAHRRARERRAGSPGRPGRSPAAGRWRGSWAPARRRSSSAPVPSDQADGRRRCRAPRPPARRAASSGPSMSSAIAGSARKPIARLVTVMPTWAPESCVESAAQRRRARPRAPASPSAAARSTVARSTVTNENSAATNAPHATHERERRRSGGAPRSPGGPHPDRSDPRCVGTATWRLVAVAVGHREAHTSSTRTRLGRSAGRRSADRGTTSWAGRPDFSELPQARRRGADPGEG